MSLREVKSWMRFWGWTETDGAMLKRDVNGIVIAHRGDAVWEADIDKAIEMEKRFRDIDKAAEMEKRLRGFPSPSRTPGAPK